MTSISIDAHQLRAELSRLQQRVGNMRPVFLSIGEILTESTKQRFVDTTAPDGTPWLLNSVLSTLEHKEGDRPLTDSGILGDTIKYGLLGVDAVIIGSPMEYAAMQQFGGTKAEFPHLWGDIPARAFLGLSAADRVAVYAAVSAFLYGGAS